MDHFYTQETEFLQGELVWVYLVSQEMCDWVADKFRALPSAKVSSKAELEAEEEEEEEEEEKVAEGKAPASRHHGSCSSTLWTGTWCIMSIALTQLTFSPTELRHVSDRRHASTVGGDSADQQEARRTSEGAPGDQQELGENGYASTADGKRHASIHGYLPTPLLAVMLPVPTIAWLGCTAQVVMHLVVLMARV
jgi:hypothetical protein